MDVLSKSDPLCVLYYQPFGSKQWAELKRTECLQNTLNPDFATKIPITYHFEEQQHLKFMIFDIDSTSQNVNDHDFLGEFECTLAQLVSSHTLHKNLVNACYEGNNGSILIITEELGSCKEELDIQFIGQNLENRNWFCSINPFLELFKANEDGTFTLVHRTDPARTTKNPVWKEFSAPLRSFCSGDYDRNIQVSCKDFKKNGNHKLIGSCNTTVRKLIDKTDSSTTYWLINEERKLQMVILKYHSLFTSSTQQFQTSMNKPSEQWEKSLKIMTRINISLFLALGRGCHLILTQFLMNSL